MVSSLSRPSGASNPPALARNRDALRVRVNLLAQSRSEGETTIAELVVRVEKLQAENEALKAKAPEKK
jgi:hypothetical protein